jgi:hypothetical protein
LVVIFGNQESLVRLDQSLPLEDRPLVNIYGADIMPIFLFFKNSALHYLAGRNRRWLHGLSEECL